MRDQDMESECFATYRTTRTLPSNNINLTCLQIKLLNVNYIFGKPKQVTCSECCIVFNHIIRAIVPHGRFSHFLCTRYISVHVTKSYTRGRNECVMVPSTSQLFAVGCKVLADSLTSLRDRGYYFYEYYKTRI